MKQYKLSMAFNVLSDICNTPLPVKKAYEVYTLVEQIKGACQFAIDEEKKYINEFNGVVHDDGTISFDNTEKFTKFQKKMNELNDMDVDIEITPVVIKYEDFDGYKLSPVNISNLEGFITFE